MGYLLDTSVLVEVLRAAPKQTLVRRLSQVSAHERWTSVITVSQLLLAARMERNSRLMQDIVRLVAAVGVAPYDLSAAQTFAKLRASGSTHQTDDVMIAAIALSRDWVLVTRRGHLFRTFEGLRLEDWVAG